MQNVNADLFSFTNVRTWIHFSKRWTMPFNVLVIASLWAIYSLRLSDNCECCWPNALRKFCHWEWSVFSLFQINRIGCRPEQKPVFYGCGHLACTNGWISLAVCSVDACIQCNQLPMPSSFHFLSWHTHVGSLLLTLLHYAGRQQFASWLI